ncbi:Acid phosphatase type 7 [Hypsibius exemplaris]|uniref:Purple acid phosphatase n=1 Tax=Hypsibius exemplaris TaxID=2072580 RepID=A0A9X6NFQ7_HYPEX|nr:Acid phosphatase type 7 [Hypsibius exemplaris]
MDFFAAVTYLLVGTSSVSGLIIPRPAMEATNLPEQIHLSWSGNPTEMYVTWATPSPSTVTSVKFGLDAANLTSTATGTSTVFVDGAKAHKVRYIHRVTLVNLVPATRYYYSCGSDAGWATVYTFRSIQAGTEWSPRLLVYGDMGSVNARSLQEMTKEVQADRYDLVLHVGDFAYDMDNSNGDVGDDFLRALEPLAAIIPYVTVVGNHEQKYNFSHYRNRFTCPGNDEGMFYSINVGPLHLTVMSTEFYFFLRYGVTQIYNQYYWLAKDLTAAAENADNGWIFVAGHRPMYCSNPDMVDCNPRGNIDYAVIDSVWVQKTQPGRPVWYRGSKQTGRLLHSDRKSNARTEG